MSTLEEVRAAAMSLPPDDRERLAGELVASLEKEEGYDEAWDAEIARRIEEIDSGRATTIPWEDVRAELDLAFGPVRAGAD
jgi:putative addiction module component (TIGR02574 family)